MCGELYGEGLKKQMRVWEGKEDGETKRSLTVHGGLANLLVHDDDEDQEQDQDEGEEEEEEEEEERHGWLMKRPTTA
ncbi:hypothetical protein PV325_007097 [Microctonus aethiopoides]|nr:hypothetical protein PV325_007097 [Microctonus aethiopoides]